MTGAAARPSAHAVVCELLRSLCDAGRPLTTPEFIDIGGRDPRTVRNALHTLRRYGFARRLPGSGARPDAWLYMERQP